MLASGLDTLRLTLHVLAASIWVGGQIVMAGLVGPSRRLGAEAPEALARAFARLAWPAYAVLVLTGFWNISTFTWADQTTAWKTVLMAKIVVVALAGLAALLHQTGHLARPSWPSGGRWPASASVAALVMGILLGRLTPNTDGTEARGYLGPGLGLTWDTCTAMWTKAKETLMLADIFGADLLIVAIVLVVLLFGGAAIPKLARNLGSAKNEFEKGMDDGKKACGRAKTCPRRRRHRPDGQGHRPLNPVTVGPPPT